MTRAQEIKAALLDRFTLLFPLAVAVEVIPTATGHWVYIRLDSADAAYLSGAIRQWLDREGNRYGIAYHLGTDLYQHANVIVLDTEGMPWLSPPAGGPWSLEEVDQGDEVHNWTEEGF